MHWWPSATMTSGSETSMRSGQGSVPQEALLSARGHAESVGTEERPGFARGMVSAL